MCLFHTKRFKITALWHCVNITLNNKSLVQENILINHKKKHFKTVFPGLWGSYDSPNLLKPSSQCVW